MDCQYLPLPTWYPAGPTEAPVAWLLGVVMSVAFLCALAIRRRRYGSHQIRLVITATVFCVGGTFALLGVAFPWVDRWDGWFTSSAIASNVSYHCYATLASMHARANVVGVLLVGCSLFAMILSSVLFVIIIKRDAPLRGTRGDLIPSA